MSKTDIRSLRDEALAAFWQVILCHYSQAGSGDLSVGRTVDLNRIAGEAITEWIANNVPPRRAERRRVQTKRQGAVRIGLRFRLTRPVDRFQDFIAAPGLTGTVTVHDEGGVWAKMDEHIAGAEQWDNEIHWVTEDEFASDTEPSP